MFFRIALIAAAIFVSGCSDPNAANEKNFRISIQKTLDDKYPRCYVTGDFPVANSKKSFHKEAYAALVAAGLLSVKDESHEITNNLLSDNKETIIGLVFRLTEKGNEFYKADVGEAGGMFREGKGGFCFGKATVKEITEFTAPADAGGVQLSQVTFTYQVSDLPAWAKLPEISAAIPALKDAVESEKNPLKGKAILILTNNGWKAR